MTKNSRLVSLDIFRGLTVAFMIIVNTPGRWKYVYAPLRHAKWHGCTPTDLVFPFFLFIVGVSMWYSLKKYGHELNGSSLLRILRRTASIFALIYLIADVLKFQKWAVFFIIFGTNALFVYFLAGIWTKLMLFIQIPSGDSKMSLYTWFYEKICVPDAGRKEEKRSGGEGVSS